MNDVEFHQAYTEQNRRDQITYSTLATVLSIILNLSCSVMDYFVYPTYWWLFLKVRIASVIVVALTWVWFQRPMGRKHHRIFGVMWYASPFIIILWMIYVVNDRYSPYYAGLNIILLAVGLLSPWTYIQNLISALLVLALYIVVCFAMTTPLPSSTIINNTTFLVLTAVIVVGGSVVNARQRYREFELRWELDKNRRIVEENNLNLDTRNKELAEAMQKLTEAESQLVQQEKMASLGVMSAGIIHEINNPLNYATTGLFTLRKKSRHVAPEERGAYEEVLNDVEEGVSRVKNIVSDLRMFTHPNTEGLDQVEVAEAVTSALRFLSNEWKDKVRIEQTLPEHHTVWANKNKLIHVFVNLVQNSLDAMSGKVFNGEPPTIWITGRSDNTTATLVLRDNGPGIAPENLPKVFDPFFTTKDVGEGMGLGLSICYRIMAENGGKISVHSEPGKFCEFTLEFPLKG